MLKGESQRLISRKQPRDAASAEAVAIEILQRLAADEERLVRFLTLTGLDPGHLRQEAERPGFLVAVLDHVASDESLLLVIADELSTSPTAIMRARDILSPPPDWSP